MDWNFILSLVTAGTAILAIFISYMQIKNSNSQTLFDRRLETYIKIESLLMKCNLALFERFRSLFTDKKRTEYEKSITIRGMFDYLVNNTFLSNAKHCIDTDGLEMVLHADDNFNLILFNIEKLYKETELIFPSKIVKDLVEFLALYKLMLDNIYNYIANLKMEGNTKNKLKELNDITLTMIEKTFELANKLRNDCVLDKIKRKIKL